MCINKFNSLKKLSSLENYFVIYKSKNNIKQILPEIIA